MSKKKTNPKQPDQPAALPPGVRELKFVQASTLSPNPANWRQHSAEQLSALGHVIKKSSVGWAGALLFNEQTGRLLDGHARLKVVDPEEFVPVLVGTWSEDDEKKILLTLDPIGAMATASADALRELADQVDLSDTAFAGLSSQLEDFAAAAAEPEPSSGSAGSKTAAVNEQWSVLIRCTSEENQAAILSAIDAKDGESLIAAVDGLEARALNA